MTERKKSVTISRNRKGKITIRSKGGVDLRPILSALAGEPPPTKGKPVAYEKTKALLERYGVKPTEVEEIISTYAEELAVHEPHATNAVEAANSLAIDFRESLE